MSRPQRVGKPRCSTFSQLIGTNLFISSFDLTLYARITCSFENRVRNPNRVLFTQFRSRIEIGACESDSASKAIC